MTDDDDRPDRGDFFSRDWQERLRVVVDLVQEISHHSDPAALARAYSRRMRDIFPASRRVSLSRRAMSAKSFCALSTPSPLRATSENKPMCVSFQAFGFCSVRPVMYQIPKPGTPCVTLRRIFVG